MYYSHWNIFSPIPLQLHLQSYLPSYKLIAVDKTQWSWKTDFSKKTPFQTPFSYKTNSSGHLRDSEHTVQFICSHGSPSFFEGWFWTCHLFFFTHWPVPLSLQSCPSCHQNGGDNILVPLAALALARLWGFGHLQWFLGIEKQQTQCWVPSASCHLSHWHLPTPHPCAPSPQMCLRPTHITQQLRHSFAVTASQSEMWHGTAGHGLTHGVCILLSPSVPSLLPTHPFLLHISPGKNAGICHYRISAICFQIATDLLASFWILLPQGPAILLDTTHIFIFPLCELCSRALPRKFHWDWTAVTGLECKFARQTMRDCIRSLTWGVFIPSPLTTLLLSQNEIRLTRHNLFPVNSYSTHDTVI